MLPMKSPSFQVYVRDVLCSPRIRQMRGEAFRAYWMLLYNSWLEEPRATLPSDDRDLMHLADVRREDVWLDVREQVLAMFVTGPDGRIYNERLMEESKKQDQRTKAGASGWSKTRRAKNGPSRNNHS